MDNTEKYEEKYVQAQARLRRAMEMCLHACDKLDGANLPEMISNALTDIAMTHGSERLVEHRPGSWEAEHVRGLDMSPLYRNDDTAPEADPR